MDVSRLKRPRLAFDLDKILLASCMLHRMPPKYSGPCQFRTQEGVFDDCQLREQRQFLVDGRNTGTDRRLSPLYSFVSYLTILIFSAAHTEHRRESEQKKAKETFERNEARTNPIL
jgi:hypothetical protein